MYMNDKDWNGFVIILLLVVGLIGWGVIEGIIWILSHVSFIWGNSE